MLYTRRGNGSKTKSSKLIEALGTLDELNSLLGIVKVRAVKKKKIAGLLQEAQNNLFIAQAELAGALKTISSEKVAALEKVIDGIEKKLLPLKSFVVPGGTELGALFDFARAVARRAEHRVVVAREEKKVKLGGGTMAYLNRLSSLLYALARLVNHESGIKEEAPTYQ